MSSSSSGVALPVSEGQMILMLIFGMLAIAVVGFFLLMLLQTNANGITQLITAGTQTVLNLGNQALTTADAITGSVFDFLNVIWNDIETILAAITSSFQQVANTLGQLIVDTLNTFVAAFERRVAFVVENVTGFITNVLNPVVQVVNQFIYTILSSIAYLLGAFTLKCP